MRTLLALMLMGCVEGQAVVVDPGATDEPLPTNEPTPVPDITPLDGPWSFDFPAVLEDSCGFGVSDTTVLDLQFVDGAFAIDVAECDLVGADFTCEGEVPTSLAPLQALLVVSTSWEGRFVSEEAGEGEVVVEVTCDGLECGEVPDLIGAGEIPCIIRTTTEFTWIGFDG